MADDRPGTRPPPPANAKALATLRKQIGERPTWAAVSTHAGEERTAVEVHLMLRRRHPDLLSIIVPRHPERSAALASEFAATGLKVARRSAHEKLGPDTDILLGDTIGEMGLYLRLTEIAFVGRSLEAQGGQNPLEPAMLNTAILSGQNVQNFLDAYQRLLDKGGAKLVRDRDMLAGAVNFLLKNDAARHGMMAASAAAVEEMRGALARTLAALEPFIRPLVVQVRLQGANG